MARQEAKSMTKTQNTPKGNVVSDNKATKATIKSLIADLASKDGVVRVKARQQLGGLDELVQL